jgi:hypothetical protein
VTFRYWEKRGARRRRADGHSVVLAMSASEAIGIVSKRWEDDTAAAWEFRSARSMRSVDEETEIRRREKAYAQSRAGQAEAGAAALARIQARRAGQSR